LRQKGGSNSPEQRRTLQWVAELGADDGEMEFFDGPEKVLREERQRPVRQSEATPVDE